MRRVRGVHRVFDRQNMKWNNTEIEGDFHGWHPQYEEFESGPGNYTVGLVELDDGKVLEILPNDLIFIK